MFEVALNAFRLNRELGECRARDVFLLARYALVEMKLDKHQAARWVAHWAVKLAGNH
jgi:hypothetical protein